MVSERGERIKRPTAEPPIINTGLYAGAGMRNRESRLNGFYLSQRLISGLKAGLMKTPPENIDDVLHLIHPQ